MYPDVGFTFPWSASVVPCRDCTLSLGDEPDECEWAAMNEKWKII
jgi:hypothetical protein